MYNSTSITNSIGRKIAEITFPKTCPHCHEKAIPRLIHNNTTGNDNPINMNVALTFRCIECNHYFVNEYQVTQNDPIEQPKIKLIPYSFKKKIDSDIPERVQQISPDFVEIYEQSLYAEKYELNQLVGIGLRKATEFLLKDYAIHKNPDDIDKIKSMYLMPVITQYYSDQNIILTLAKATTWLGNDETHYLKLHTDKDLSDLKMFLKTLVSFIDNSLVFEEAILFTERQM